MNVGARGKNFVRRRKQGELHPITSDRLAPLRAVLATFSLREALFCFFFRYNMNT